MSDKTIDDDTLRAMLAARTPGEWEMRPRMAKDEEYYVEVRGAPGGYLGCRYHDVGGTWEPVADAQLWAAAPALAAEVLRLRGMLRAASGALAATRADLHAQRDAARAYRDATDVPDGEYDATRHAEALAALNRVLGGGQ